MLCSKGELPTDRPTAILGNELTCSRDYEKMHRKWKSIKKTRENVRNYRTAKTLTQCDVAAIDQFIMLPQRITDMMVSVI